MFSIYVKFFLLFNLYNICYYSICFSFKIENGFGKFRFQGGLDIYLVGISIK